MPFKLVKMVLFRQISYFNRRSDRNLYSWAW